MQTLGLEVDFVNTVQFSNHTGYESFTGTALEGNAL
jgi:pyridoxine kinase